MKRIFLAIGLFLTGAAFWGCHKNSEEQAPEHQIKVEELSSEIRIPSALWENLEKTAGPEKASGAEEESLGASATGALFMAVDVVLTEKNPGVLKEPSIRMHFPRGGGVVDFASLMGDQPGSFYVRFAWPDAEEGQEIQTWFVSKARRRKIGKEVWGAGCGKYFRITDGINKLQKENGLKLNTTRNRHLTVLGGHFIFSSRKNDQTFLSQVTFKDSRFESLYCEEL